jgi:ribonucleoside-diphosphate reductase alpha chain
MDKSVQILSDITVFMKYSRYLKHKKRRETWKEIVDRNKKMHLKKFPDLKDEIVEAYKYVYDKKVLPSMRSLQFGGKPIEISPNRCYNCAYLPVDDYRAFSETMFLLLGGTGVGYSVQKHHVEKLPPIKKPRKDRKKRFLIGDSIEGWADAIKVLMRSYFEGLSTPEFDYSDIRSKGALLVTSGGRAPGPQPLKDCIHNITKILDSVEDGEQLSTLQCHDIQCFLADAVLSGGIRRAALIALFSFDDEDMTTCKFGEWWELNPQRGRANNSAVALRYKITLNDFLGLWDKIEKSNSGEPGILFSNDKDWGRNPCGEIGLRPFQFCNLCEINANDIVDQTDFNARAKAASFIGTLQASYTNFHYLRDIWRRTTEKESLLGIGITGICSGAILGLDEIAAARVALDENERVAKIIGINKAARVTTVKPSGTSSLVLGCSSGIHGWHSKYYIRRIRVGKNESIYKYLVDNHPELVEDDYFKPTIQAVISVPQKAPDDAIFRDEDVIDLLERVKRFNINWVKTGHRNGNDSHNVSATISIKEDEWKKVGDWMWENRECYSGLSVLPYSGGSYVQAPFERITEDRYNEMVNHLKKIDLTQIMEDEDETDLQGEVACQGHSCEIT